ncbi:MAG TPA: glycosyltransferase family 39 protein [Acidobacteriaceae bacterium]|nr:glycosyltransferase family 39 protein [Acidobacteriaceae bacterium]
MESARSRIRPAPAVALILALGFAYRLFFLFLPVTVDDDALAYAQLARNWFHHGVYGFLRDGHIAPTLVRLPGYPFFLGVVFSVFGAHHERPVMIVQALIDLAACWLLYDVVRTWVSPRAGWAALLLAVFCPFTAAYTASGMTESLSVSCVALAIWSLARVVRAAQRGQPARGAFLALVLALSYATLLRPDGALLSVVFCAALYWYARRSLDAGRALRTAIVAGILAALPFIPWTIRNARTFHVFQPLVPRDANNPGEFVPHGFQRWLSTWSLDYVDTGTIAWNQSDYIDPTDVAARACDTPAECQSTQALIAEHNQVDAVTPQLDAQFAALAAQRVREHPLDFYFVYPAIRVVDMWLRPRTELFNIGPWWWAFRYHPIANSIAIFLGLVNLGYVLLAIVGFAQRRVPLAGALLAYLLLRSLLLATLDSPEQRYTMEFFPILFVAAACVFARDRAASRQPDLEAPQTSTSAAVL